MPLTAPILPPDPTLDEMRAALGIAIPAEAVFDGWTDVALASAAATIGIDAGHARLAFPNGAMDMISAWYVAIDAALVADFPPERIGAMKVRDRIGTLIRARLALMQPQREAARSALAILAQPTNLPRATRLGWHVADLMWRIAGDTATDFNHYTKRMTLGAVYTATLLVWLDDDSEEQQATNAFLDRRLGDVMRIEKVKARFRVDPERTFSLTRLAGRLRYPTR